MQEKIQNRITMEYKNFEDVVDETIDPRNDFNAYVNKKWYDNNPIPDEEVMWGVQKILGKKSVEQVQEILNAEIVDEELQKAIILFNSGMDTDKLEKEGYDVIKPYLELIDQTEKKEDLSETMGKLQKAAVSSPFGFDAFEDRKDTSIVVPNFYAGGTTLPDRDYYLTDNFKEIREKYFELIKQYFFLLDEPEEVATQNAKVILRMETKLAEKMYTNVEKRDPNKNYNKKTIEELAELFSNFDIINYLKHVVDIDLPYLVLNNPILFETINELFETESLNTWKAYLKFKVINFAASYLNEEFESTKFNFFQKTLYGRKEQLPRSERVINVINGVIGELVGKLYVSKYFPTSHKERMLELVANLFLVMEERVNKLDWMSDETKVKALKKLSVFNKKIGYPDEWKDFSECEISADKTYVENILVGINFLRQLDFKKLFGSPDPLEWLMSPQTVNAYFHPLKVEIVFPAAYLQFPNFSDQMSDAEIYGAIGVTIGHEITHGFDDKGSLFDHQGNLRKWWSDEDRSKFEELTKYFIDEYNKFEMHGIKLNGELCLGENIADIGGLKIAYDALQKHYEKHGRPEQKGKFTPEQVFFLSYARSFKDMWRKELYQQIAQTDPHPPSEARINIALAQVEEFHQAFDVKSENTLYRGNVKHIW